MPYAQAKVIEDGKSAMLISYETPVILINDEGWFIITGLYSATTRKHISAYMRELGLSYEIAKQMYEEHKKFNIYTGEVVAA